MSRDRSRVRTRLVINHRVRTRLALAYRRKRRNRHAQPHTPLKKQLSRTHIPRRFRPTRPVRQHTPFRTRWILKHASAHADVQPSRSHTRDVDRVAPAGLRPPGLPHHRTCGTASGGWNRGDFSHPRSDGIMNPYFLSVLFLSASCMVAWRAMLHAPRLHRPIPAR